MYYPLFIEQRIEMTSYHVTARQTRGKTIAMKQVFKVQFCGSFLLHGSWIFICRLSSADSTIQSWGNTNSYDGARISRISAKFRSSMRISGFQHLLAKLTSESSSGQSCASCFSMAEQTLACGSGSLYAISGAE